MRTIILLGLIISSFGMKSDNLLIVSYCENEIQCHEYIEHVIENYRNNHLKFLIIGENFETGLNVIEVILNERDGIFRIEEFRLRKDLDTVYHSATQGKLTELKLDSFASGDYLVTSEKDGLLSHRIDLYYFNETCSLHLAVSNNETYLKLRNSEFEFLFKDFLDFVDFIKGY